MPAERLSMRKVREVLHLKHALGMSYRRISSATGASKTQAADYVRRAALVGSAESERRWPKPRLDFPPPWRAHKGLEQIPVDFTHSLRA